MALEKVNAGSSEYLAVRKLKPEGGGEILCFLWPSRRRKDFAG